MLVAKFIPHGDERTVEEALNDAKVLGMVLCRPSNFSPDKPFHCCAFRPGSIPAGWTPMRVIIKTPKHAAVGEVMRRIANTLGVRRLIALLSRTVRALRYMRRLNYSAHLAWVKAAR